MFVTLKISSIGSKMDRKGWGRGHITLEPDKADVVGYHVSLAACAANTEGRQIEPIIGICLFCYFSQIH